MPKKGAKRKEVEEEVEETEAVEEKEEEQEDAKKKTVKKQKSTTTTTTTTKKKPAKKADEVDEDEDAEDAEDAEDGDDADADEAATSSTDTDFATPEVKENQLKIMSWNVAGFNAVTKKGFKDYVEKEQPDILCLQETKILPSKVPKDAIPKGYEYHFSACEKTPGHHGTALLTKVKPISVTMGMGVDKHDKEGRIITAEFEKFYLVNTYVPNSGVDRKTPLARLDYRTKEWDVDLFNYMRKLNNTKPVIWTGDLNVAHKEIDLKNPKGNARTAGFTIEERTSFTGFLESGFVDTFRHFNPKKELQFTFWSYMRNARASNAGWRLDYFIVPLTFIGSIAHSFIRSNVTGSDHCPIGIIVDNQK